jgi:hypothetical protein
MHIPTHYKLTEGDLHALAADCGVSAADVDRIIEASRARQPHQSTTDVVRVPLDRAGNITVRSIQLYGGERFGQPYHYLAEVVSLTTHSAFSRFLNRTGTRWLLRQPAFEY